MRLQQGVPLLIAGILAFTSYAGSLCGVYETCIFWSQLYDFVFPILDPIFIFSLFSIPAVLLLPIVRKRVFDTWLRFATVWIILAIIVIGSTATQDSGWFSMIRFVREDAARIMGILFSALSLFLIAWQTYTSRKVRG